MNKSNGTEINIRFNHRIHLKRLGWRGLAIMLLSLLLWAGVPNPAFALSSPLAGLMELRQLQQESTPYEVAIANHKPTFLEFYATWCSVCRDMAPAVRRLHESYADQINFVLLDIDDPRWVQQVEDFKVNGIPQMTLLNADQQVLGTQVGRVPPSILANNLDRLLQIQP